MKRAFLGEFDEVLLLTVAVLDEAAYGVTVTQEIEQKNVFSRSPPLAERRW